MDNPQVLVVDDDPDIRAVIVDVLEGEGCRVAVAGNGERALVLAADLHPAVIFLDMRMPVLDGWGFAARYRQQPGPKAALVCMTAATDAPRWAAEIGAAAVLPKPFDLDQVVTVLERVTRGPWPA
jgi:CheY-like chemotaxis protein